MNRKFTYFGIASILFISVAPAHSQTTPAAAPKDAAPATAEAKLPSVDEVADKFAKASGGKEAWAKLQTLTMTGTVDIPTFGVSGKMEILAKRPNKILRTTSVMDGQFVHKEGFDGQVGWASDPQAGLKAKKGMELEQTKVESTFDSDVRLKEVYPDLKVTGRSKVGDRDAIALVAHEPGGKTITMYFDEKTGLRIAEDSEGPDETGAVVKTNVVLEDYRPAGDIQLAHKIRITAPNVSLVIQIEDVKLNEPVDDAKFAMPPAT
jgi:hypothetical protein